MPEGRTLYVHTGGSKSGSSALQNFFNFNSAALNEAGISYARAARVINTHEVTSGNGFDLFQALTGGFEPEDKLLEHLLAYLDGRSRAIISMEYFEGLSPEHWQRLLGAASLGGIRIHVIVFVRNTLPLLLSSYDQMLRGLGESRPFNEWVRSAPLNIFNHLHTLHTLGNAIDLTVLSYDRHRVDLPGAFMARLGVDLASLKTPLTPIGKVNRSLTLEERRLLREINSVYRERYSRDVATMLLRARPEIDTEFAWTVEDVATADAMYGANVALVNALFFGSQPEIEICTEEQRRQAQVSGPEEEPPLTAEVLVRRWLFSNMDRSYRRLTGHLIDLRKTPRPDNPDLPPDFDPVIYILLHDDLRQTLVDPYWHYLTFGRQAGLRYKP